MTRRARVLARGAVVTLLACSSGRATGCRDFLAINCGGAGGIVPAAEVQDVRELHDRWRRCGECSVGEVCNVAAAEPHCTASPGIEGSACGRWRSKNLTRTIEYDCAPDLRCNAAYAPPQCMPLGGLRASCAEDGDCGEGLACSTEAPRHCRPSRGEGEPCDQASCAAGLTCDRSTSPPRCVGSP